MADKNAVQNSIDTFCRDITAVFGSEVKSIMLTGSAAAEYYNPKISDINMVVVVTQQGMERISQVRPYVRKWARKHISLPLFFTREYINASLDSFPIEFLNMTSQYRLVTGRDVFDGLKFDKKNIRLQSERELKGNLLHLRQEYIRSRGKKQYLKAVIRDSIVSFTSIFRALLFLKGEDISGSRDTILERACEVFNLDHEVFIAVNHVKSGALKLNRAELDIVMHDYIQEVAAVSETVDSMQV